ncbi:MAG: beta-ketoacyl synthase N-terminal-like domain-containing protein, partial [Pseudomonadota bacterium]
MSDRVNTAPYQSQIIVSGYACRLPGAPDPDAFWSLLMDGRSAISDIPADRWDAQRFYHPAHNVSGTAYVKRAGLLPDIWDFDAGFFGISPREAEQMDPQQRILLELAWEAVEHGNLKAEDIAGPRTGVFVGAASCDHSLLAMEDPQTIGPNFMTGNTMSILSNRISYQFDLKGPSYTVDTACSSSFYALHLAAQSLRTGEIDTAIVAGINLILSPFPFVGFSRAAMLSPDGLCKAFDADANGYVRGEGAVVFVLRRAEAMGAHEPRRTVLAATAINSDGRTVGLSMPSQVDQTRLLQRIYGDGGIPADRVAFIEAHGTGTPIGDPIEAGALGSVIGKAANSAVPVGSAKTNVGHLEAGSGLVGLLKAQMALERGSLPASRNFETPNPSIDFNALNLSVATGAVDLSADDTPVYAGINSFGFGGSNAHAVLERINDQPLANVVSLRAKPPLVLTARSRESLAALATSWRKLAADLEGTSFNSMASIAAHARSRHPHRAVLTGPAESLAEQLGAVADAV